MRKIILWSAVVAFIIFIIDWGIIGLKIYDGNYEFLVEAYIGLVCVVVMLIGLLCKVFGNKCPYCKKILQVDAKFCSYCGKDVSKD